MTRYKRIVYNWVYIGYIIQGCLFDALRCKDERAEGDMIGSRPGEAVVVE